MQHSHKIEELTLTSTADVERMIATNKPRVLPVQANITCKLPGFTASESTYWETVLAAQRNGCGCGTGMIFMSSAVVAYIAYVITTSLMSHPAYTAWFFVNRISVGLAVLFLSAGIGKLIGLAYAQYRFKRLSAKLLHVIKTKEGNT